MDRVYLSALANRTSNRPLVKAFIASERANCRIYYSRLNAVNEQKRQRTRVRRVLYHLSKSQVAPAFNKWLGVIQGLHRRDAEQREIDKIANPHSIFSHRFYEFGNSQILRDIDDKLNALRVGSPVKVLQRPEVGPSRLYEGERTLLFPPTSEISADWCANQRKLLKQEEERMTNQNLLVEMSVERRAKLKTIAG
eukprot:g174.t1